MQTVNRNRILPIQKSLWFLVVAAVVFQSVMLCYNHLMGVYVLKDVVTFLATLILGSVIATVAGFTLAVPDYYVIKYLDKRFTWSKNIALRIMIQPVLTVIIALVVSTILTLLSELIIGYKEPLGGVLIRNAMIFPVVNLLLMAVLEGVLFFISGKQSQKQAETLSHQLLEARFELLKNQISPHFMFNNLNVLSALIDTAPSKAQLFVDEFADIYRYVLDTIEKPVVRVSEELNFIKSYLYMLTIRHGETIVFNNNLPKEVNDMQIPPFALQTVIENAVKHNIAEPETPLRINISYRDGFILVENGMQPKISAKPSTGLGQQNLIKRYELVSDTLPEFIASNYIYTAKLPIINDESSYN